MKQLNRIFSILIICLISFNILYAKRKDKSKKELLKQAKQLIEKGNYVGAAENYSKAGDKVKAKELNVKAGEWFLSAPDEVCFGNIDAVEFIDLSISPQYIAAGGGKGIELIDIYSGERKIAYREEKKKILTAAVSHDTRFVVASYEHALIILDTVKKKDYEMFTKKTVKWDKPPKYSSVSSDDFMVVSSTQEPFVDIWNISKRKKVHTKKVKNCISPMFTKKYGFVVFTRLDSNVIEAWNYDLTKLVKEFTLENKVLECFGVSDNDELVTAVYYDKESKTREVVVWDFATAKEVGRKTVDSKSKINTIAITAVSNFLITGNNDGEMVIRMLPDLKVFKKKQVYKDSPVNSIKLSNDNAFIVVVGDEKVGVRKSLKRYFLDRYRSAEEYFGRTDLGNDGLLRIAYACMQNDGEKKAVAYYVSRTGFSESQAISDIADLVFNTEDYDKAMEMYKRAKNKEKISMVFEKYGDLELEDGGIYKANNFYKKGEVKSDNASFAKTFVGIDKMLDGLIGDDLRRLSNSGISLLLDEEESRDTRQVQRDSDGLLKMRRSSVWNGFKRYFSKNSTTFDDVKRTRQHYMNMLSLKWRGKTIPGGVFTVRNKLKALNMVLDDIASWLQ